MNRHDFIDYCHYRGITVTETNGRIVVDGGPKIKPLVSLGTGLSFPDLTSLPEGVTLNADWLYLEALKVLPEDVIFNVGRRLHLPSLISEHQIYQGQPVRIRSYDSIANRIYSSHCMGKYTIHIVSLFKGNLEDDPTGYVAEIKGVSAHGRTIDRAIYALRLKMEDEEDRVTADDPPFYHADPRVRMIRRVWREEKDRLLNQLKVLNRMSAQEPWWWQIDHRPALNHPFEDMLDFWISQRTDNSFFVYCEGHIVGLVRKWYSVMDWGFEAGQDHMESQMFKAMKDARDHLRKSEK